MKLQVVVRVVALFEGAKGALILLAGAGALSLLHHDVQRFAEELIGHLHLNPAKHYPRIFIDSAAKLTDSGLLLLAVFAAAYSALRFAEAYGLWRGRRWAEWLAAVSGGIYIPFEIYELAERMNLLAFGALGINVAVVALMIRALLAPRAGTPAAGR